MNKKDGIDMIHFKWIAEGSKNWNDVIDILKEQIKYIEFLKEFGCKMIDVDDGHLKYTVPEDKVEEYCNRTEATKEYLFMHLEDNE